MKIDLRGFVPALGATVLLAACGSPVANAGKSAPDAVAPATRLAITGYEVVATYPHDPEAYTQGLLWHQGDLYEGTGRYDTSWLRRVATETGEVLQQQSLASNYFGEGIALLGERIFQLTWLSNKGFVYDLETFDRIGEFSYDTEGWGLTTDGTHLILSDGSDRLFFLDGDEQFVVKTVRVTHDGEGLDDLNELEYIDGLVYANVWHSDFVYLIDPASGDVVDHVDFSDLGAATRPRDAEAVLNGIAYNSETGHLYLTGKNWPELFEVRLIRESP